MPLFSVLTQNMKFLYLNISSSLFWSFSIFVFYSIFYPINLKFFIFHFQQIFTFYLLISEFFNCENILFFIIFLIFSNEVLSFVNTIAEIVHTKVSNWRGQCNKNLGWWYFTTLYFLAAFLHFCFFILFFILSISLILHFILFYFIYSFILFIYSSIFLLYKYISFHDLGNAFVLVWRLGDEETLLVREEVYATINSSIYRSIYLFIYLLIHLFSFFYYFFLSSITYFFIYFLQYFLIFSFFSRIFKAVDGPRSLKKHRTLNLIPWHVRTNNMPVQF